ncbi:hypothetical protein GH877_30370, partial [Bacillus thuringiensis]|nr:hypothetical protein [Bacillus thuringiensis]
DYKLAQRVFKNYMDNSLTISGLYILDTGKYTCVASNGLDMDEANAQLVVQAPPSEATNIFVECFNSKKKAQVSWEAGSENYAPIL